MKTINFFHKKPNTALYKNFLEGFTLIELLAVVTILAILMGIVIPVIGEANRKAKLAKVKATIAKMELALSSYETDWNRYPPTDGSGNLNNNSNLYTYLYLTKSLSGTEYMPIKESEINSNNQLLDPWKIPYVVYILEPSSSSIPDNNNETFDIYSKGPNRNTDTGGNEGSDDDDINNWSRD